VCAVFTVINAVVFVTGVELVTDDAEHHGLYPEFLDDAVADETLP
jgi:hypothetical protein